MFGLSDGEHKPVCLSITAVPEEGVFKMNRFHINKSNIRRQWFMEEEAGDPVTGNLSDITMSVTGNPTGCFCEIMLWCLTQEISLPTLLRIYEFSMLKHHRNMCFCSFS
jgi:hypothetical protein